MKNLKNVGEINLIVRQDGIEDIVVNPKGEIELEDSEAEKQMVIHAPDLVVVVEEEKVEKEEVVEPEVEEVAVEEPKKESKIKKVVKKIKKVKKAKK